MFLIKTINLMRILLLYQELYCGWSYKKSDKATKGVQNIGLLLFRYGEVNRSGDDWEDSLVSSQIPRRRSTPYQGLGHAGNHGGWPRDRRRGGNLLQFLWEGTDKAGEVDLGLASWIISAGSGAQGLCLFAWYLVFGRLGQRDLGPDCESLTKEVGWGGELWIDWSAFESTLYGEFTLSRNWLTLGEASLPGQQSPKCQSIRI